ncbi:TPA: hypothetical protein ACVNM2_000504 [Klebsiella pneumoniae]
MNIETVNELIATLESAGELSIKEKKVMALAKAFKQLAAENVALKAVFSHGEIPSEAVDAFMETAVMDHDWNETSEWSWVENETEVIHAVLDALKPETPATDACVAVIKADGVEEEPFGFVSRSGDLVVIELNGDQHIRDGMPVFVKALREGAK